MTDYAHPPGTKTDLIHLAQLEGVRTARVVSFFIDYAIVLFLCVPIGLLVGFLGIITFGATWVLIPLLPGLIAVLYLATTMGGPRQATLGMRMMGIHIRRIDGNRVDPFLAILHGVLFWLTNFSVFMLAISFFSSKKRLAQDIMLGTYVARD